METYLLNIVKVKREIIAIAKDEGTYTGYAMREIDNVFFRLSNMLVYSVKVALDEATASLKRLLGDKVISTRVLDVWQGFKLDGIDVR